MSRTYWNSYENSEIKTKKSFSPKVIMGFIKKMPVSKYEPVYKIHTEFEGETWDNVGIKAK